jgi:hypothetical protein
MSHAPRHASGGVVARRARRERQGLPPLPPRGAAPRRTRVLVLRARRDGGRRELRQLEHGAQLDDVRREALVEAEEQRRRDRLRLQQRGEGGRQACDEGGADVDVERLELLQLRERACTTKRGRGAGRRGGRG